MTLDEIDAALDALHQELIARLLVVAMRPASEAPGEPQTIRWPGAPCMTRGRQHERSSDPSVPNPA